MLLAATCLCDLPVAVRSVALVPNAFCHAPLARPAGPWLWQAREASGKRRAGGAGAQARRAASGVAALSAQVKPPGKTTPAPAVSAATPAVSASQYTWFFLALPALSAAFPALVEAAQAASPLLVRLELAGNPCLSCGPGASLSATQRASILASWRRLCGEDGGASFCATLLGRAFETVPETRALVGLGPAPEAPPPEAEAEAAAGEAAAEEESAESVALRAAAADAAAAKLDVRSPSTLSRA